MSVIQLMKAINDNEVPTVQTLLGERSINLNVIPRAGQNDGSPLLVHALWASRFRIARILVDAGADVNLGNDGSVRDKYLGKFPLKQAVQSEFQSVFIDHGNFRTTAEDMLALNGLTQFLIEHGADVNKSAETCAVQPILDDWDRAPVKAKELLRVLRNAGLNESSVIATQPQESLVKLRQKISELNQV